MDTFLNTAESGGAEYILTKKDKYVLTTYIKQMRINYISVCVCAMTIVLLKIQSDQNSENLYLFWRGNHPLIDWKPTMIKTTNNLD